MFIRFWKYEKRIHLKILYRFFGHELEKHTFNSSFYRNEIIHFFICKIQVNFLRIFYCLSCLRGIQCTDRYARSKSHVDDPTNTLPITGHKCRRQSCNTHTDIWGDRFANSRDFSLFDRCRTHDNIRGRKISLPQL